MIPGPPTRLIPIRSDPALHFRDLLVTGAAELESLDGGPAFSSGQHGRGLITTIQLISIQQLDWELVFYTSATLGDLAADPFIARWRFNSIDGVLHSPTSRYHYFVSGLEMPCEDRDLQGRLHVALINRSATTKNAGDAGKIVVQAVVGVW